VEVDFNFSLIRALVSNMRFIVPVLLLFLVLGSDGEVLLVYHRCKMRHELSSPALSSEMKRHSSKLREPSKEHLQKGICIFSGGGSVHGSRWESGVRV
jgi:hypothetical protein